MPRPFVLENDSASASEDDEILVDDKLGPDCDSDENQHVTERVVESMYMDSGDTIEQCHDTDDDFAACSSVTSTVTAPSNTLASIVQERDPQPHAPSAAERLCRTQRSLKSSAHNRRHQSGVAE